MADGSMHAHTSKSVMDILCVYTVCVHSVNNTLTKGMLQKHIIYYTKD